MPEELLPKPPKDLPLPEKDLPLPEKEITAHASEESDENINVEEKPHRASFILKSFLLGIFFVILIIAIGGASFLLGRNTKGENKQVVKTQISNPTSAPDPTNNWKTYNNPNLGFIFKYPSSWSLLNNERLIRLYPPEVIIVNGLGPDDPKTPYISIDQYDSDPVNCKGENCPLFGESKPFIVADKYNAKLYSQMEHTLGVKCKCNTQRVVLKSEDTYYVITLYGPATPTLTVSPPPISQDYQKIFESLLSTFELNGLATESKKIEIASAVEKELGDAYINVSVRSIYNEDYALGSAGFNGTGGGIEFIAHQDNGIWKVIWRGNEVPGCSEFSEYPDFPKGLNCDSSY